MRRKEKCVSDPNVLHSVIRKAQVCRLGLVDGSTPYIIPMSFGFDGTHLYVHSAKEGRKIDILDKNNRVCLEFEQDVALVRGTNPCNSGFRYLTVICHGTADVVCDAEEKCYGLNQIVKQYEPEWSSRQFTKQEISRVVVFKIIIEQMIGKVSGKS
jgi:nitroimidazol reductase NimA-like FMN-containing flavoprotein (pyridoxamine 5'-phosphate oxidase superfamily)